jgi:predicted dehydrogenase
MQVRYQAALHPDDQDQYNALHLAAPAAVTWSIDLHAYRWYATYNLAAARSQRKSIVSIRIAAIEVSHWHSIYDAAYLRQLRKMPGVELAALHDPNPAVATRRAAEVGQPPVYTDWRAMLAEVQPDFVLALGRHDGMAEVAHHLLDAGMPFLMEKPMGLNAAEVRSIADKAHALNRYAALPLPQRYSPFMRQARAMLADGRFGPLSHLYMRMNRFSSARYAAWDSGWMMDPRASGGGCLRNLGVHAFDVFLQLTGEDAEVTAAQTSTRALGTPVEDYVSVLLRSASGVLGTVEIGNVYPRRTTEGSANPLPSRDKLLDGADGEWKVCGRDALLMAKDGLLRVVDADGEQTLPGEPDGNPAYQVLHDALTAWRDGRPPPADADDCWRSVRLIDAAYGLAGPTP